MPKTTENTEVEAQAQSTEGTEAQGINQDINLSDPEGIVVWTLAKPISFEGQEIKTVTLDFDKINGATMETVGRRYSTSGNHPLTEGLSMQYCGMLAAEISSVPYELIQQLKGKDYFSITALVRNFLL
jgi:hypothetical protein